MKNKKRKGFIVVTGLIIMVLVFAITMSMSKLAVSNTVSINTDSKITTDYYVAMAGLQLVYGALTQGNLENGNTSIISRSGPYRLDTDGINKVPSYTALTGLDIDRTVDARNPVLNEFQRPRNIKDSSGRSVGVCQLAVELYCGGLVEHALSVNDNLSPDRKRTKDGRDISSCWCYKIESRGFSNQVDAINKEVEGHTLTMFVYLMNPTDPKIYDGKKDLVEVL